VNAFTDALAALHADANLARRAFYSAGGTGPQLSIGVIYAEPEADSFFGDTGKTARDITVDILLADAPALARNDTVQIAPPGREPIVTDPVFLISTVNADEQSITARCKLRPQS
jgi:hypothetical protein